MGKLREELQQRKPFSSLREEAMLNVWRTGDFMAQRLQYLLKAHGISQTQYNVLRILRGSGADGLPCGEIAGRMLTRDPDITRLLDRLVRGGLARRTRIRQDRRVIRARITPAGARLLSQLEPLVGRMVDETIGHIQDSRLSTLITLLEEVRAGKSHPDGHQ
jgi:MarR family transcriptional regulator, organic hydroperoxide resistance regulator